MAITAEQAKQKLIQQGITAKQFAEDNDLDYVALTSVLNGSKKGRYGEPYRAALALGMIDRPTTAQA